MVVRLTYLAEELRQELDGALGEDMDVGRSLLQVLGPVE